MILYFSGTGNSEYAAKRIGQEIQDDTINLFEKIRSRDFSEIYSDPPWVMVVPTYAWRIPRIVEEWLENTGLVDNKHIYFIMTCGGNAGNAGKLYCTHCMACICRCPGEAIEYGTHSQGMPRYVCPKII